jgi:hypothetical protein
MSFANDLLARPANLSLPSKYLIANGFIYLGGGVVLLVWPGAVQTLLFEPAFVGHEEGLFRVIGVALAIVGWLCLNGGRSGTRLMVAATVPDRVILVPVVLVPLAMSGVFPHFLIAIAILDPLMGIGAWLLLRRSARR